MMHRPFASTRRLAAPLLLAIAALLTACGGGSDEDAGTPVVGP